MFWQKKTLFFPQAMLMNYICNLMKPLIKTSVVQNEQQNNKKSHQNDSPIAK